MRKMNDNEMRNTNGGLLLSLCAIGVVTAAYAGALGVARVLSKASKR